MTDQPPGGTVSFGQNQLPAVPAGEYQVTVTQLLQSTVTPPADSSPVDEAWTSVRSFAVQGPRFALNPGDVAGFFPPANSQGDYGTALPHAAFSRLTLPWERSADAAGAEPWLAVLVLDTADGAVSAAAQVGDLQRTPFARDPSQPTVTSASTLAANTASYPDAYAAQNETFALEYGQSLSDRCQVLDIPVPLFAAVAPSSGDLVWLAHTRAVTGDVGAGVCAVVAANRTPAPGATSTAYLVSLEGMSPFLPASDGTPASVTLADGTPASAVRLVSLLSWSFAALDPAETFEGLLEAVNSSALQLPVVGGPSDQAGAVVGAAAAMGYAALNHQTRVGDTTVSWYRGPCTPYAVADGVVPLPDPTSDPPTEPVTNADALVRYDPATGMMDVSYAAAWQLGRLLALQSGVFSTALYSWKRTVSQQTALAVELELVDESVGDALSIGAAPSVADVDRAAAAFVRARLPAALALGGSAVSDGDAGPPVSRPLHSRTELARRLAAVATSPPDLARLSVDTDVPDAVTSWLAQLAQLSGVPLAYLVPDERLLPSEAIRFFFVDPNWVRALLEGAFSIARATQAEVARDTVLAAGAHAAVAVATPEATGFLLRSNVVSGWPGLGVIPYDADGNVLTVLRLDQLTSTVLLCLVAGAVDHVDIHEPFTALHLALGDADGEVDLRWVTVPASAPAGTQAGDEITTAPAVAAPPRGGRVIEVAAFAAALQQYLDAAHGNDVPGTTTPRPFTSAEFALQLAAGAQAVRFAAAQSSKEAT